MYSFLVPSLRVYVHEASKNTAWLISFCFHGKEMRLPDCCTLGGMACATFSQSLCLRQNVILSGLSWYFLEIMCPDKMKEQILWDESHRLCIYIFSKSHRLMRMNEYQPCKVCCKCRASPQRDHRQECAGFTKPAQLIWRPLWYN